MLIYEFSIRKRTNNVGSEIKRTRIYDREINEHTRELLNINPITVQENTYCLLSPDFQAHFRNSEWEFIGSTPLLNKNTQMTSYIMKADPYEMFLHIYIPIKKPKPSIEN